MTSTCAHVQQIHTRQAQLYGQIKAALTSEPVAPESPIIALNETDFFGEALACFGPQLPQMDGGLLKKMVYLKWHRPTSSLIVGTRGFATLSQSPLQHIYYVTYLITLMIYVPGHGLEEVEVGIVGDIYQRAPILRAESHCAPSFYFGSQECNCYAQWSSIREVGAYLNPVAIDSVPTGSAFVPWLKAQFALKDHRPHPVQKGPGVVMLQLKSQAGMGIGVSEKGYVPELAATAGFRQALDQTTAQALNLDMMTSLKTLGLPCDGRLLNNGMGYKIPVIVADYLELPRTLRLLSGSGKKKKAFVDGGYEVSVMRSIGAVDGFCQNFLAARSHTDAYQGKHICFEDELARLKQEVMEA